MNARPSHPLPDEALRQHIAVLGKTGSGKSYLSQGLAETLLDRGERVCVIDPTGRWWGLRSNAAGTGPGFPVVVFGGAHADIALSEAHGQALAEIIGTTNTPAILDTRAMSVGARTRFFTDFAETLLQKNRGPLHLIVDEAHLFAPQGRVNDPQSGKMLHAANNLISLGRGIGLRVTLITQRPAKLHKDSLTQVETLIALRLIAPQDRRAVEDWIGEWADPKEGRELLTSLPSLPTGTGWIWAPELGLLKKATFPKIRTYDSGRAPAEDDGAGPVLASIDVPAIQERLGSVAAEAKANDPKALKAEIARLNGLLRNQPIHDGEKNKHDLVAARQEGRAEGYREGEVKGRQIAVDILTPLMARIDSVHADMASILRDLGRTDMTLSPPADVAQRPEPRPSKPMMTGSSPAVRSKPAAGPGENSLLGPQRQFLSALAWWAAAGHSAPTRAQVAAVAGWRVTSGHLKNVAGSLRTLGLIIYPSEGTISMTPSGVSAAPAPDAAPLVDRIRGILTGSQRQVFDLLLRHNGSLLSRDAVASGCGWEPTSGHVKNVLGSLRSLEIIDYPQQGYVALAGWVSE